MHAREGRRLRSFVARKQVEPRRHKAHKVFTGIIEETGRVERVRVAARGALLAIRLKRCASGLQIGDSLAVNGCCLTVARIRRRRDTVAAEFDLLTETWDRTNLGLLRRGSLVNLERALAANGRLGGHFVTGHIDGVGTIRRWEAVGDDYLLEVSAPAAVMRYAIFKGSIAVDGISLTVAKVSRGRFQVWIIPHTRAVTNLARRAVGQKLNLEGDLLGKYVERFLTRWKNR